MAHTDVKTKMEFNRSSLFLGILLALTVFAAVPGYARSTTGFNSFHILGKQGAPVVWRTAAASKARVSIPAPTITCSRCAVQAPKLRAY